ncbi:alpha/beta fold hydrolase [Alkalihalobacterium chitinilyticum]|uniref:Alpha/beta hydrolase n=1 Tax=Alkalihalobacterium chitinilyticum TaxID=2980103 RepID=A0ABT5VGA5_9BACI|nr:alpha/beta hydrolase [Alkalihalobacterium chitinilyticum]MDE5414490.1 alpha/beta hydrolase [Alkalihalobacterium chitinilyticum]
MPTTNSNGAEIYYEVHGQGEPLLLIMGLSHNSLSWFRTLPELAKHYKVIIFDNRGCGKSETPTSPYSIELMAEDARAVLDAAEVDSAHVYGISMGGMIAQRLTLLYPERVKSLVLGCTTAGGPNHVQPSMEVSMQMMARANSQATPEEMAWEAARLIYSSSFIETNRDIIAEDIKKRIEIPTSAQGYMLQLQACLGHHTDEELHQIKCPTLVFHGDADVLVPYPNGQNLANKIPNAELITIPGAGHIYTSEAPDLVHNKLREFLGSQK